LRLGTWHRLDAGTILMAEGSPGDSFHLLMEGRVAISRNGIVLSTIDAGVSIGEMTYLQSGQQMRTATATAATDVFILVIRNEALRQASAELQAQFDKAFIKLLVGRLVATNRQIAH
jgi:CRP-like cAMP-binding protein